MAPDRVPVRVGVTGHINLTPATERLVADALRVELRRTSDRPVHGVTCLAAGTDQIFARAVLDSGGTYEVILPARDYRDTIRPASRADFDELLNRATQVIHTGYRTSGTAAYVAANRELLLRVQRLLAVWDGEPGCHAASTDRTVTLARARGIPTTVLWPANSRRASREP
ncbi:hypothetical protein SAMN05443287_10455 [Micromonospora phaseoli]|uniref:Uncharacterized protein n=1 Tax=Micromonospora phaseoli TaxID=1144548 RepID=A0A1H6Y4I1_9ACTN|nr:hypothetical protein [Micromonospora phaseoli]PZW00028.1 hypothetical protein CLV64_10354 [Micromonospora phaseoli]GIJ80432.1 hypothetical protein Xph01_48640 [Micromonospora phaseoli]SEJ36208.1 hypothetical protein SAMN05443287_10455 [Micromonospora phaseoli]